MITNRDNLREHLSGYSYYQHSQYPLDIQVEQDENNIKVTIRKFFKGKEVRNLTKGSATCGYMSDEQVEEYILDVIEIFLK